MATYCWGVNLMKGPAKLTLAIALALAGGNAFALGLGAIQVKSGLNQPLDAEIPVITESAAEVNGLSVDLASSEDFERIGLSRSRMTVPIEMAVGTNARGETVIKLTTKEAVREPLLDFLLVANWSKGKVLREYTVLLDPPITAPAKSTATVAPLAEKPVPIAKPLTETKPAPPPPKPARAEPKPPVAAATPKAPPKAEAKPAAPPPAPKPATHPAGGNDYGPVAEGETLSGIARATKPDDKSSVNQMMLALLKANPNAFYQDNINALKRGSILRIPSGDDMRASGTLREAAEQVHSQNEAWTTGRAAISKPTLVAHTGATTKTTTEPAAKPAKTDAKPAKQERLALVPPSAAKNDTSTDRAGAAGGTGKENAEVKAELARTKEALSSREQEASEMKSRVKQLEEISAKDQRLIALKDSEIADLQKKLKELQAKASAPAAATAAAKPAETAPAKPAESTAAKPADTAAGKAEAGKADQKLTAKDIWGDLNGADKNAAKPAAGSTPAAPGAPPATAPTPPATPPSAAATPPSTATETAPTAPSAATAPTTPTASDTQTPSTVASTSTPSEPAASALAAADTGTPAAKPSASTATPVKTPPPAKVTPLEPAAEPFYKSQNVLLGGGAALLLVGLLALMRFMRKPKPAFAPSAEADDVGMHDADEEELRLRDALQQNPANTAASLDLLRHYYAHSEAAKFEAAAETMHAHLFDPHAPEWDEVLAMGAVIAPNHPLFTEVAAQPTMHETAPHMHEEALEQHHEEFVYPGHEEVVADDAATHVETFDMEPASVTSEPAPQAMHDDSFDFDLPMQTEETARETVISHREPEPLFTEAAAPAPVVERQDDIYVGEDAIGTKLDLAKAYLDMGDPEGAKSMLDEVLAEGNDSQRDEARRLLAEIH
jgi:pilus assembly protein FimV